MPLFGTVHLCWLIGIGATALILSWACRRRTVSTRAVRLTLGLAIAINELIWWAFRYSHEGLHVTNLPFQLCDLAVWVTVAACLTAKPALVEVAYFAGIAGAGMATLTPDLWSPWPTYPAVYFFLAHGGVVIASLVLVYGKIVAVRPGAVWRAFGVVVSYAAGVGLLNKIFGTNYMYLCRKPASASLLSLFGPWPWYLAGGAGAALALFWLLWLPLRSSAGRQRALAANADT